MESRPWRAASNMIGNAIDDAKVGNYPMAGSYEFFAGGGMVRAGLGPKWSCLFANDLDPIKGASYERLWGASGLHIADVVSLTAEDLPGTADLAWASFPCQDLSLTGSGGLLSGSSGQTVMIVEGSRVHSRLLVPREGARLRGLPDDYELPEKHNEAYRLAGDGVAVPVLRHLAEFILDPPLTVFEAAEMKTE